MLTNSGWARTRARTHVRSLCIWQLEDETSGSFETRHTGTAIHQLGEPRGNDFLRMGDIPQSLHNIESIHHLLGIKKDEATVPVTLHKLSNLYTSHQSAFNVSDSESGPDGWALVALPEVRLQENLSREDNTVREIEPGKWRFDKQGTHEITLTRFGGKVAQSFR